MLTLEALADRPIWVGWRAETRKGKTAKIPYDPRTGAHAKCDNSATWRRRATRRSSGRSRAPTAASPLYSPGSIPVCRYSGIDLDTCIIPEAGDPEPWAGEIIDRFDSYTEISPSGTGVKLFFTVANTDLQGRRSAIRGKDRTRLQEWWRGRTSACDRDLSVQSFLPSPTGQSDRKECGSSPRRYSLGARGSGPKFAGEKPKGNGVDHSRSARPSAPALRSRPAVRPMRPCALRCSITKIRASPIGQDQGTRQRRTRAAADFDKTGGDGDHGVSLVDFVAYMQSHDYIFMPAGDFWPAARVNARLPPVKLPNRRRQDGRASGNAGERLARQKCARRANDVGPGLPQLIRHRLIGAGGWIERKGVTVFNLYRPPTPPTGDPAKAEPWIAHIQENLPRRGRPHHHVSRPPRAAPA